MSRYLKSAIVQLGFERKLEQLRVRRRAALMRRTGVAFVHVPRTAGFSASMAVYGRFIGHFPLTALLAAGDEALVRLPRFAIVRDPFDRLVSAWGLARKGPGSSAFEARIAPHVSRELAGIDSFERFVKAWLPRQDLLHVDGVFRPQTHYLADLGGNIGFDHLGRTETLAETEAWLSEQLGRPIRIPHINLIPQTGEDSQFDAEMRSIVGTLYSEDFERLGYPR